MKTLSYSYILPLIGVLGLTACSPVPTQNVKQLTSNNELDLSLSGTMDEMVIVQSLEPGAPIQEWKAQNLKMRETGERIPERVTVAELHVTYADGQSVISNIRYGESISSSVRDWWNKTDGFIHDLAFAEITQADPIEDEGLEYSVAYRFTWPNPRPDHEITSATLKPAKGLGNGSLTVFSATPLQNKTEGTTYFVSPAGNDSAPGSFDEPWVTLQKAADQIKPGDTVYVRGGSYNPTQRIVFKYIDAPEGQRTRVIGWPGETANFDFMNTLFDYSETRKVYGFEALPHDAAVFVVYSCDRFTLKNLHLQHSRTRGFSFESGFTDTVLQNDLINQGRPEHVDENYMAGSEIMHCSVFLTYGPGIHIARQQDGRCVGNLIVRGCNVAMAPKDSLIPTEIMGRGPLGRSWKGFPIHKHSQMVGNLEVKPPMESLDTGFLTRFEIGYNDIGWNEAECMLIDGDTKELRIHHNYVHDAYNFPWVFGIGPNGYGNQQSIEVDHNIAEKTGGGFGFGIEGGGTSANGTMHHNISKDCHWNGMAFNGGGPGDEALFENLRYYNNTIFHCGYLEGNEGGAGGMHFQLLSDRPSHADPSQLAIMTIKDITIANNLVLQPRDYAIAFTGNGTLEELGINLFNNMTDLPETGARMKTAKNKEWRVYTESGLIRKPEQLLRDPTNYDFRPVEGSPVLNSGKKIKGISTGYVGAFGPNANWVELD